MAPLGQLQKVWRARRHKSFAVFISEKKKNISKDPLWCNDVKKKFSTSSTLLNYVQKELNTHITVRTCCEMNETSSIVSFNIYQRCTLEQGTLFLIASVNLLICQQSVAEHAGRSKGCTGSSKGCKFEGGHSYQRARRPSQHYINTSWGRRRKRTRESEDSSHHVFQQLLIFLTCGQPINWILLLSPTFNTHNDGPPSAGCQLSLSPWSLVTLLH